MTQSDPTFDPNLATPGQPFYAIEETCFFVESMFVDRDYYVQTITDDTDGTVLAFSVTTRNRRFRRVYALPPRPRYFERRRLRRKFKHEYQPSIRVVLGRSTFASLDPPDPRTSALRISGSVPEPITGGIGASRVWDPGYYQTVILTASDVGAYVAVGKPVSVQLEIGGEGEWPDPDPTVRTEQPASWDDLPEAQRFRRQTIITTYTVIGLELPPGDFPTEFGPQLHVVRTLQ